MDLELHIMRGDTITSIERREPGLAVVKFQMGITKETLQSNLEGLAHPSLITRIIDLYSNPKNIGQLEQLDAKARHLIIRDYA